MTWKSECVNLKLFGSEKIPNKFRLVLMHFSFPGRKIGKSEVSPLDEFFIKYFFYLFSKRLLKSEELQVSSAL